MDACAGPCVDRFGDAIRTRCGASAANPLSAAQEHLARRHVITDDAGDGGDGAARVGGGARAAERGGPATATRHVLRETREQLRGTAGEAELNAAVDLYNAVCADGTASLGAPAVALWGRSLAFAAECYFADSPRHYEGVLAMAYDKLVQATTSPSLDAAERLRAEEALGRVLLLQARRALYSRDPAWQRTLDRAATVLRTAAVRSARADAPTTTTAPYDAARAAALAGDEPACREWLEAAASRRSLPPLRVVRVEPDLAAVRDRPWFRRLSGGIAQRTPDACPAPEGPEALAYSSLRATLIDGGFSVEPVLEHLRYPLYMDRPRGPLVDEMVRQAEARHEAELRAGSARERLQKRLRSYGLRTRREIPGDGNCQFSSVSDQLYDTIAKNDALRQAAVAWLRCHGDWDTGNGAALRWFVDEDWGAYCRRMARPGVWGDHLTLLALCQCLGVAITVVSSVEGDNFLTELQPLSEPLKAPKPGARVLLLSHYAESHYESVTYA
eukprot:m51a1_g1546 hypothetical protein (501) ;mRNA; f:562791-564756